MVCEASLRWALLGLRLHLRPGTVGVDVVLWAAGGNAFVRQARCAPGVRTGSAPQEPAPSCAGASCREAGVERTNGRPPLPPAAGGDPRSLPEPPRAPPRAAQTPDPHAAAPAAALRVLRGGASEWPLPSPPLPSPPQRRSAVWALGAAGPVEPNRRLPTEPPQMGGAQRAVWCSS